MAGRLSGKQTKEMTTFTIEGRRMKGLKFSIHWQIWKMLEDRFLFHSIVLSPSIYVVPHIELSVIPEYTLHIGVQVYKEERLFSSQELSHAEEYFFELTFFKKWDMCSVSKLSALTKSYSVLLFSFERVTASLHWTSFWIFRECHCSGKVGMLKEKTE